MNYEFATDSTGNETVTLIPIDQDDGLNFRAVLRAILASARDPQSPCFMGVERQRFMQTLLDIRNPASKIIMNVGQFEGLTNQVEDEAAYAPSDASRMLAREMRAELYIREKEVVIIPDFVDQILDIKSD